MFIIFKKLLSLDQSTYLSCIKGNVLSVFQYKSLKSWYRFNNIMVASIIFIGEENSDRLS